MKLFEELFGVKFPVISVVHLNPLPGAPLYKGEPVKKIAKKAMEDAEILIKGGVNGLIIENMGDVMFQKTVGPETVASVAVIAKEIRDTFRIPMGMCILQNDAVAAIALAKALEAEFIRVGYYTEVSVNDAGWIEGSAAQALRYRKYLESDVKIFADVQVKHSYPIMQRPVEQSAEDAFERGLADAVIITGIKTGGAANPDEVRKVKETLPEIPLIVGSGVNSQNLGQYASFADSIIVSSGFCKENKIPLGLDSKKVTDFMDLVKKLRKE